MGKRKIRINAMDFVILLVIAAAMALVLYIFVWSGDTETVQTEYTDITYVVEVTNLDERYADLIKNGQRVEDAVERGLLGTVTGTPEVRPTLKAEYDNVTGQEVYKEVPGKINLYITITAEAAISDRGYTVAGDYVYVGRLMSMLFADMQCYGYCIQLQAEE